MSRFCATCGRNVRPNHLSTAAHRRATRPRREVGGLRARPAWMVALRGAYEGTDEENLAAAARLGLTDWSPA